MNDDVDEDDMMFVRVYLPVNTMMKHRCKLYMSTSKSTVHAAFNVSIRSR